MQSGWHNCPTINGVMQKEGISHKANDVQFQQIANNVSLSMDIAAAYPAEAAVKKYIRKFDFDPSKNTIQISENYELLTPKEKLVLHFLVHIKPTIEKPGKIVFNNGEKKLLEFNYDAKLFDINIEDKLLDDERITGMWGKQLYRINLTAKDIKKTGKQNFTIQLLDAVL
jgi:hypothetical protein